MRARRGHSNAAAAALECTRFQLPFFTLPALPHAADLMCVRRCFGYSTPTSEKQLNCNRAAVAAAAAAAKSLDCLRVAAPDAAVATASSSTA